MAVSISQTNRLLSFDTPVLKDVLLLRKFVASESISHLFHFNLELIADIMQAPSIPMNALIGQKVTIHLALTDEYSESQRRFFNGIVSRFAQGQRGERVVHYQAEVVPWLWLLTLTSDCRVFQDKTVPEIIKLIFDESTATHPALISYRDETTLGKYVKLDYCVQYRETDFNFVSRLMEQEGIFYFFEHEQGKHTLVLTDSPTNRQFCPVEPNVRYQPEAGIGEGEEGIITAWEVEQELRPGKYVLRDYHFQMPSKSLEVTELTMVKDGGNDTLEIYDYPGEYAQRFTEPDQRLDNIEPEGRKLAKLRMEEEEVSHSESRGTSLGRDLRPGYCFKLMHHYDSKLDGIYLLTSVQHSAVQTPDYFSNGEAIEPYTNSFTCIPDRVPFRPSRATPKPVVQGPQTAMVVGKEGEEIWTDRFGRVKVRFHWDREKKRDEDRSCWIRVSHPWAGKGWGSVSIPRIGQEVIVDFIEGDPDQPIITGRVYNAETMPPYTLPDGGVVSGIKSNSTPGGGGYNEISMNDTKKKEQITVHAQYNMGTTVEHDDTQTVHNDRTITVDGIHTEKIKKDTTITILEGPYKLDVQKNTHTHHVNGDVIEWYDATQETHVFNDITIISGNAKITLNAKTEIVLQCGESFFSMKQDGTILLSGKNIEISGTNEVKNAVGNQNTVFNTQKVATSGAAINTSATGMHEITGAVVKIN